MPEPVPTPAPIERTPKTPLPFMIGADPEFTFLLGDRVASADDLIDSLFANHNQDTDFDEPEDEYRIGDHGVVGCDGCSDTAELRPTPANTPEALVENLRALIAAIAQRSTLFTCSTLSFVRPIGGHLHFDIPNTIYTNSLRVSQLHAFLSTFYLPLIFGDHRISLKVRSKNYGKITDYRIERRGPSRTPTYEFRVPSAEWLTTPRIARATIAYLATVLEYYLANPNAATAKYKKFIYQNSRQGEAIQQLAFDHFSTLANGLIRNIRTAIRTFPRYKAYRDDIEFILNAKRTYLQKTKVHFDILQGWGLVDTTPPSLRQIQSPKKVAQKLLEKNNDVAPNYLTIPHNDDLNVSLFAQAFKQRIIAFNWKLKHRYFLFGIRKGIPHYFAVDPRRGIFGPTTAITTVDDLSMIDRVFDHMVKKFNLKDDENEDATLGIQDEEFNELCTQRSAVLIGIPYQDRVKQDFRPFFSLIHRIERGALVPQKIEAKTLRNDRDSGEQGPIAKVYSCANPEETMPNILDDDRQHKIRMLEIKKAICEVATSEEIRTSTSPASTHGPSTSACS